MYCIEGFLEICICIRFLLSSGRIFRGCIMQFSEIEEKEMANGEIVQQFHNNGHFVGYFLLANKMYRGDSLEGLLWLLLLYLDLFFINQMMSMSSLSTISRLMWGNLLEFSLQLTSTKNSFLKDFRIVVILLELWEVMKLHWQWRHDFVGQFSFFIHYSVWITIQVALLVNLTSV